MDKIKYLNKEFVSEETIRNLNRLKNNENIENIYCLIESHIKKFSETPSSICIKTNSKKIYPDYSSSLNCGMGLLQTNLNICDLRNKIVKIFQEINNKTTLSIIKRYLGRKEVNKKELEEIFYKGIEAMPSRYNKINNAFGNEGNVVKDKEVKKDEIIKAIPNFLYRGALRELGKNAGGNHFIEMQIIDEIFDHKIKAKKGDVYFMIHLGTGYLGDNFNNVYLKRKNNSLKTTFAIGPKFFNIQKLFFLIKTFGIYYIIRNFKKLFKKSKLKGLENNTKRAKYYINGSHAIMNFGYAWRYATYSKIIDVLKKVSEKELKYKLLLDRSHNSIFQEKENYYYLRNCCKLKKTGDLFILPGNYCNNSYLCQTLPKLKKIGFNIDHGLGMLLKKDKEKDLTFMYKCKRTRIISGKIKYKKIKHEKSQKINEVIKKLEKEGYFKILLTLKPIASLK